MNKRDSKFDEKDRSSEIDLVEELLNESNGDRLFQVDDEFDNNQIKAPINNEINMQSDLFSGQ